MSENKGSEKKDTETEDVPITMLDFLEMEEELEDESAAVLGGSDEKCCTYIEGYIKRQALYSCLTCCPEGRNDISKAVGICLACSLNCHENHELIELYTKRNFRCDCPTQKIPGKNCFFFKNSNENAEGTSKEQQTKLKINSDNLYNQNFTGVYCICKRPYPDPEDPISDEMIQCVVCEDWYHTRHLKSQFVPQAVAYSEMICDDCIKKNTFLIDYFGLAVQKVNKVENENKTITITADTATTESNECKNDEQLKPELDENISDIKDTPMSSSNVQKEGPKDDDDEQQPPIKKLKLDEAETNNQSDCKRPTLSNDYKEGALFWPDVWRKSLCSCSKCLEMYNNLKVSFLLDLGDRYSVYEETGLKKPRASGYERGIEALLSLGHTQKIDLIGGYNHMIDKFKEFLKSFADKNKVVTAEDIKTFFQQLKNERNPSFGQQHFCR